MGDQVVLQCMEVFGGNEPFDAAVGIVGLDAWVCCRPHQGAESGGDVYYVSSCATGRITRLLLADVAGHGSGVGEIGKTLRQLMRRHVNFLDQCHFVRAINQQFASVSRPGSFATAIVSTFFSPTRQLSLCNAGHPPPLRYRAQSGEWSFLEASVPMSESASNIPLGVLDLTQYEQFEVKLDVGDLVVCYTDALIEARDRAGEMLGQAGLLELVKSIVVADASSLCEQIIAAVSANNPGSLESDDLTLLVIRPNGTGQSVPLREKLLSPFRITQAAWRSLRGSGEPVPWPEISLANIGGALCSRFNRFWSGARRV